MPNILFSVLNILISLNFLFEVKFIFFLVSIIEFKNNINKIINNWQLLDSDKINK